MARRHKYAGASAAICTALGPAEVARIAEESARRTESLGVMVRLEESTPGRLVYSLRNRMVGGHVEFMTFAVTLTDEDGGRMVRTRILSYKQKRSWILVIPLPWQMLAWGSYRKFMYTLASCITRADAAAKASVIELAPA